MKPKIITDLEKAIFAIIKKRFSPIHDGSDVYKTVFAIDYKNQKSKIAKATYTLSINTIMGDTEDRLYPISFMLHRNTRYNKKYMTRVGIDSISPEMHELIRKVKLYNDKHYLGNYSNYKYHSSKEVEDSKYHPFDAWLKGFESSIVLSRSEREVKLLMKYISDPSSVELIQNPRGFCEVTNTGVKSGITGHEVLNMETSMKQSAKLMRDMRKTGVEVREAYKEVFTVDNKQYSPESARDTMVAFKKYKAELSMELTKEEYDQIVENSYSEFLFLFKELMELLPDDMIADVKWAKNDAGV